MNNKVFFVMAINFLIGIKERLSTQLQSDFQKNNVALQDQVLELKKEISGGGTIDLLDATDERVDGINSFDKNRLKTGRAFVFDEVAIGYATNAASGLAGNIDYVSDAPKELRNAVFILEQEGREVLRMPIKDLNNKDGFKISDAYKELRTLHYFADNREITAKIKFPPGVTLDAGVKHYVYLRINGAQTSKKSDV
ncbi:hypothetical protein GOQ30_11345 [Flavobacterium sp. TP390]|uniref:Uncharacterized protein n=1 Tax=Flavobacterium profundi TaxID=1774945 RepID=A0A6I4IJ16_9FLAO|nr:hypothetical protein [Flavobacterium profundi]MVO09753.1 hypothetical protein [Flavobacterium profundi]